LPVAVLIIPRLEPYLASAAERDTDNEVMLSAREMADVLAPLLAAGVIKGETGKRAATAINRLNLARHHLEMRNENWVPTQGHPSWLAALRASTEARVKDPEGNQ
jgi:hypothetical protein